MTNSCKIFLTFLFSINGLMVFGQSYDLILTREQNERWFDSLEILTLESQLDVIKLRILNDTIVYNLNQHRHDIVFIENVKKEEILKGYGYMADGRILYFVKYNYWPFKMVKFIDFRWNNWTSANEIKKFHDFLTIDKIKSIEIISDDNNESAIFGSMAGFGVIIFNVNRKKFMNDFEENIGKK